MRQEGSITAYLCLILTLMLSLIFGSLESVRYAHARVMTSCAMDQGLYSLFARYDQVLLEQYELFFVNGGSDDGSWQPDRLCQEIRETASKVLSPAPADGILRVSPANGQITEEYVSGFCLATDQEGWAFSRQVCEAMKESLTSYGIQQLSQTLMKEEAVTDIQEQQKEAYEDNNIIEVYEEMKESGGESKETESENREETADKEEEQDRKEPDDGEESGEQEEVQVPDHFVNPIEVIRQVMQMGILSLVLPYGKGIPSGTADTTQLASNRELQSGFGIPIPEEEASFVDKLLTSEYVLWKFPCYTNQAGHPGLNCQVEYAIVGKDSDKENLTGVVTQLLVLREAANLLHLMTDQGKRGEMESMSAVIAASIGLPAATGVIMAALAVCWAFAESVLDLRELLDGGKVALIKDASSWQLSLEHLPELLEKGDEYRKDISGGVDYRGYLRILMQKKTMEELTLETMDLVEYNMRTLYGKENFRLDCCVDELSAGMRVEFGKREYQITRNYGYRMET
ncbi:MAG: DUF5702 domain-containing protein [Lachnospiraceae bacterium]|nr:DUF5702 domain-containing protein [Lachnospiraceae bacterium]